MRPRPSFEASRPVRRISRLVLLASLSTVPTYRIGEAANLLGISDDTMRRLVELEGITTRDEAGRRVIEGDVLATLAQRRAHRIPDPSDVGRSARNRLVGLITAVISDKVMTQVEMQCGPARIVSLMSTEAAEDLGLTVGDLAVAVIKSTMVAVETPRPKHH
jgi:molybdopterin-binding protein